MLSGSATPSLALGHIALPEYVPILMYFPTVVGADTMRMGFVVDVTKML